MLTFCYLNRPRETCNDKRVFLQEFGINVWSSIHIFIQFASIFWPYTAGRYYIENGLYSVSLHTASALCFFSNFHELFPNLWQSIYRQNNCLKYASRIVQHVSWVVYVLLEHEQKNVFLDTRP